MSLATLALREDYWETFELGNEDVEFLYNHLLETELPLTSQELLSALVKERILREKRAIERQRSSGGVLYLPKETYKLDQQLVFPGLNWKKGKVAAIRPGQNPDLGQFQVIQVQFAEGDMHEFASGLSEHKLNNPPDLAEEDAGLDFSAVISDYGLDLLDQLESDLHKRPDFVRIAGKWFPRALLVDINAGHLNLAEAILDMAGGGPLHTAELLEQVGLSTEVNSKLVEFSLDLALQEDPRFDEVGPAGEVLWFLNRLEPEEVLQVPYHLRYSEIEYDPAILNEEMQNLERKLDDELSPQTSRMAIIEQAQVQLIYPHWRAGTLPLSNRIRHIFPTAYEAPRIRFMLIDSESDEKFPAWVVLNHRYVLGLKEWYTSHNLLPGSLINIQKSKNPGEVIIHCDTQRSVREWVRTVLVGSDGGVVFAMLKQMVSASFNERMTIAVPDIEAMDQVWKQMHKERIPFERIVVNTVRELAKLNPQSHVHASELYAAINIIRRCPPGPILALLASRPWFVHVGDLHFRFEESEKA
ncbi:MAG: hypothetical protein JW726_09500 [Anaerolineales bacterium]|nr:hypothetical protein [Anaerolineales bacterium]